MEAKIDLADVLLRLGRSAEALALLDAVAQPLQDKFVAEACAAPGTSNCTNRRRGAEAWARSHCSGTTTRPPAPIHGATARAVRRPAHHRELEPIGDPVSFHRRPAPDVLLHPEAVLLTGITPQQCARDG